MMNLLQCRDERDSGRCSCFVRCPCLLKLYLNSHSQQAASLQLALEHEHQSRSSGG